MSLGEWCPDEKKTFSNKPKFSSAVTDPTVTGECTLKSAGQTVALGRVGLD